MFHSVTHFDEEGKKLKTYDSISEASKDTGINTGSIRSQINGKRKYCFWYSHVYKNNVVLYDGRVITLNPIYSSVEKNMINFLKKFV